MCVCILSFTIQASMHRCKPSLSLIDLSFPYKLQKLGEAIISWICWTVMVMSMDFNDFKATAWLFVIHNYAMEYSSKTTVAENFHYRLTNTILPF